MLVWIAQEENEELHTEIGAEEALSQLHSKP